MSADLILTRLDKLRRTGEGRWIACCPAHSDTSPSLSVRELPDGRVLLHCFGGCDVHQVVAALGLDLADLYPSAVDDRHRTPRERNPFSAGDALRLIDYETTTAVTLIVVAAHDELSAEQRTALFSAAASITAARRACGLREVKS